MVVGEGMMNKVLLYSIKPEHLINILNGRKTIEIRKSNLPKWTLEALERGEVVTGYGYCTKGKPYYSYEFDGSEREYIEISKFEAEFDSLLLNGKVVVKFQVSGSDRYFTDIHGSYHHMFHHIGDKACLSQMAITQYGNGADLYAHHLTNIQPIEPMELSNLYSFGSQDHHDFVTTSTMIQEDERKYYIKSYELRKAPQSYMTAWVKGE